MTKRNSLTKSQIKTLMKLKLLPIALITLVTCVCSANLLAATTVISSSDRQRWLKIAEEEKPELQKTKVAPVAVVSAVNDKNAFQNWRFNTTGKPDDLYSKNFKDVKEITLDFGDHYTGYFTFHTKTLNRCLDAPVRLKFTFGEMPAELNTSFDPWKGSLGRGWMQDEIINLSQLDEYVTLSRRLAC